MANNDIKQIKRLTSVLSEEFAVSHNSHSRKGGLIGLAAAAIALGKVSSVEFVLLPVTFLCVPNVIP